MDIEEKLKNLPAAPGVYIMKGRNGEVLYIGKAKSLKSRVRSYFREGGDTRYSVKFITSRVEDIDYIVTANEKEALFLEDTLLKRHKPRYNIRLKDSKTYVSIKLTVNEKFPRILVTRYIKKDGARYFGPYVSARDVRDTIKFIRKIFPICTHSITGFRIKSRPCLDYQLGLCAGPEAGLISEEAYRELVNGAILFLEGRNQELIKILKESMNAASRNLDFEKAAAIRDRISAIAGMLEEQKVVSHRAVDRDVFAFVHQDGTLAMQALFIRDGRLLGGADYLFEDSGLPDEEVMSSFIAQFYRGERFVPDEVILPVRLEDAPVIGEWISGKKGRKVSLIVPIKGEKLKLLKMAESNAREALRKKQESAAEKAGVLEGLQKRLHLKNIPERIEAFDISNIGGTRAVGAMVTFTRGEPDKGSYRLFKIRTSDGPDDYAMMHEVLSRRYGKSGEGGEGEKEEKAELPMPDLILMDGGKGQLNIALKVIGEFGIKDVDIVALAKERPEEERGTRGRNPVPVKGERVYLPNVKDPILLKEGSKPDLLLRRIRDEVHRFAISYHRKLRGKGLGSILDNVKGIGAKKRNALFERFGDLEDILAADISELVKVPGITEKLAQLIKEINKD
jgi:excinuclease ABC subunit C